MLGKRTLEAGRIRLELDEDGTLWIIDGGERHGIMLVAGGTLGLLNFLTAHKHAILAASQGSEMMNVHVSEGNEEDLATIYGPEALDSKHKRGEKISYTPAEGGIRSGTIIWITAPRDIRGRELPLRYIVEPDLGTETEAEVYAGIVDVVEPGDFIKSAESTEEL
ncbi:MAG TPA: hypothetical protein VFA41_13320 [Ktedonobacteraceae bacterium]|jgi:hypothetical protein|nr:hypothetical protein [Ktedonobacteraceae bacterium]